MKNWDSEAPGEVHVNGRRPVVLVSRDSAYAVRASITVAEVTTIPKVWLDTRLSSLGGPKLAGLDESLRFSLGLLSR